jgi:2-keto-4-pentenoate hydratase/2-oxohepta-3-ene-1,7-dioic acid hydratase in catechol pathway
MAKFKYLIHFADEKGDSFFADIDSTEPVSGAQISAHRSFEELKEEKNGVMTTIAKVLQARKNSIIDECCSHRLQLLPPVPAHDLPIYCVGLNYKSHAKEANVSSSLYAIPRQRLIRILAECPRESTIVDKTCRLSGRPRRDNRDEPLLCVPSTRLGGECCPHLL